jgi:hypothetical protein
MDTDNTPFGGKIMFSAESETGGAASDKAPAKSKSEKASAKNANGKGADAVEAPPYPAKPMQRPNLSNRPTDSRRQPHCWEKSCGCLAAPTRTNIYS